MTTPPSAAATAPGNQHQKYNTAFGFTFNLTPGPRAPHAGSFAGPVPGAPTGVPSVAPTAGTLGAGGGNGSHFLLGEPSFNSTEDVANYCNAARAAMTQLGIELGIAARILEARLSQAQTMPGDHVGSARMRARRVSGKLKRTSDAAVAAAKNAVAAHGALLREYQDLITPRAQRPGSTNPFRF